MVRLQSVADDADRPDSPSPYSDWGDIDARALHADIERWLILVTDSSGTERAVGDMTAMPIWFGPTRGSMAMSIGIALVPNFRGLGIGTRAQRMLADLLHGRGVVRVQASTDVANIAEQRALAKAGFQFEGIMRGAQVRRDGRHDLQVWSHLTGDD